MIHGIAIQHSPSCTALNFQQSLSLLFEVGGLRFLSSLSSRILSKSKSDSVLASPRGLLVDSATKRPQKSCSTLNANNDSLWSCQQYFSLRTILLSLLQYVITKILYAEHINKPVSYPSPDPKCNDKFLSKARGLHEF